MAAVLVVVQRVDEAIFPAVEGLSLIGIEKETACARAQRLPAKRGLLVKTEPSVKTADHIFVVYKLPVGSEETNERICFADVALQAENAHGSILINQPRVGAGKILFAEIAGTVVRGEQ